MVKKTLMGDFLVSRTSKAMTAMKLKENDEVVSVFKEQRQIMLVSKNG